jgi:hypothetical protein
MQQYRLLTRVARLGVRVFPAADDANAPNQ